MLHNYHAFYGYILHNWPYQELYEILAFISNLQTI